MLGDTKAAAAKAGFSYDILLWKRLRFKALRR